MEKKKEAKKACKGKEVEIREKSGKKVSGRVEKVEHVKMKRK